MDKVWLKGPWGQGEPMEVDATPEILTKWMVLGYSQCEPPPAKPQEVTKHVGD